MSGTPADTFEPAGFDDIQFPYSECTVKGGLRHAIHEFPHTPGGELEKMGRKLYVINFKMTAHDIPKSELSRRYPGFYPVGMRKLRERFEQEKTADLIIPTIGKIKACAVDWVQRFAGSVASGESFDVEFTEDQESATLAGLVIEFGSPTAMLQANDELFARAALAREKLGPNFSIFQKINDAVTKVQGVLGRADAYSKVLEGKIRAVENLCAFADSSVSSLQGPENFALYLALKEVWLAARSFADNVTQTRKALHSYTVPRLMSVSEISTAIYGTSENAVDILQLNAINDAFAVPSGTVLRYVA